MGYTCFVYIGKICYTEAAFKGCSAVSVDCTFLFRKTVVCGTLKARHQLVQVCVPAWYILNICYNRVFTHMSPHDEYLLVSLNALLLSLSPNCIMFPMANHAPFMLFWHHLVLPFLHWWYSLLRSFLLFFLFFLYSAKQVFFTFTLQNVSRWWSRCPDTMFGKATRVGAFVT